MNVKELKEAIANLPDDMEVMLQSDPEGNSFDKLYCVDPDCIVKEEEEREYRVYDTDWSAMDADMEDDEWEEFKDNSPRTLVLSP